MMLSPQKVKLKTKQGLQVPEKEREKKRRKKLQKRKPTRTEITVRTKNRSLKRSSLKQQIIQ